MVPVRSMAVEALEPNRVLAGRYRLEVRLGQGGMGSIWRAEHLVLQAPVAVKLIDRDAVPDEDTLSRFLVEAKAAAALRSPHVVQIIDYGVEGPLPFMVMELLEGETLAQRIKRVRRLTRQETARVLTHVGRAVGRAHDAGIVHRDLKPENVFLVKNEDDEIAKVLDFGVAKVERASLGPDGTRTRTGSILGTPYYMSPEQAQGNKAVDSRSDLWSLGVIAFECLTGRRPFYSDGLGDLVLTICVRDLPVPSDVAPVPLGFDEWFAKACARDPEQRFQTARELTEALRDALGVDPKDTTAFDGPEIMVASGRKFPSAPPPSNDAQTIVRDAPVESSRRSRPRPEGDAPTVAAPPGELNLDVADPGIPAPTEALFGTTQHEPPAEPRSNTALVLLVAVAALGAGLVGGILFLRHPVHTGGLDNATLPAPAAPPVPTADPESEKPAKKAKKHDAADSASASPDAPSSAAAPSSSARAESAASSAASAAAPDAGAPALGTHAEHHTAPEATAAPSATGAASASDPEVPWQKPAWAIPDDEIKVHRGPDQPDDKIVIPSDK
ncbi:MAG TPA: serine/threonine-protein kinase [Polyangiaceae bacterium]|nr:serine/threonine-protein kinase [Polyangiaceae bacterium]